MSHISPETPQKNPSTRIWLTKGVWGIGLASFLADVGHEVPTALFASFVTITLGAGAAALGLIEGLADGLAGIARFAGGTLSDDPDRRRRVALGGYSLTAIFSALIGVAGAVWQVALLRMTAWTSRGLRVPARNALLADLVEAPVYGRAYSFERMMDRCWRLALSLCWVCSPLSCSPSFRGSSPRLQSFTLSATFRTSPVANGHPCVSSCVRSCMVAWDRCWSGSVSLRSRTSPQHCSFSV